MTKAVAATFALVVSMNVANAESLDPPPRTHIDLDREAKLGREPNNEQPAPDRPSTGSETPIAHQVSADAVSAARMGNRALARQHIDAALAQAPLNDPVVANDLAIVLLYEADFVQALQVLDRLIAQNPVPAHYLNRALAYRALGRYSQAQADLVSYQNLSAERRLAPAGVDVEPSPTRSAPRSRSFAPTGQPVPN